MPRRKAINFDHQIGPETQAQDEAVGPSTTPTPHNTPPKKEKKKREPSAYAKFVKEKYDSVRNLPSKERFKKIAEMWKAKKAGGGKEECRDEEGKFEKCPRGRKKKKKE